MSPVHRSGPSGGYWYSLGATPGPAAFVIAALLTDGFGTAAV